MYIQIYDIILFYLGGGNGEQNDIYYNQDNLCMINFMEKEYLNGIIKLFMMVRVIDT